MAEPHVYPRVQYGSEGISLRDKIALDVLTSLPHNIAAYNDDERRKVAKACYSMADIMLEERTRR